jgi:hypothetical protein
MADKEDIADFCSTVRYAEFTAACKSDTRSEEGYQEVVCVLWNTMVHISPPLGHVQNPVSTPLYFNFRFNLYLFICTEVSQRILY